MFNELYSETVLRHVRSPKNMGVIKDADGEAKVGNPVCGDIMKLYIKVGERKGEKYVKDVKFQTLGCGAAIASTSIATTLIKGKTLSEVKKITKQTILKALGGLPQSKIHCSVLADEALAKAIKNYRSKTKTVLKSS